MVYHTPDQRRLCLLHADIPDVYARPYDPKHPMVCMKNQHATGGRPWRPLPAHPGQWERFDYEYKRQGVADPFLFFEPLQGQRHVRVTHRRTRRDHAESTRELSDVWYPEAEKIVAVLDNLNTHSPASFYAAFEPEETRRLAQHFEFHFTPKHGSWLNTESASACSMAEIELSTSRQCLDRRIPAAATLVSEAKAWEDERNVHAVKVDWRFTTADARINLDHLYPRIQDRRTTTP